MPGRKGLLVSPSGHCWWVMLRFCGAQLGDVPSSWHGWGVDVWVEPAKTWKSKITGKFCLQSGKPKIYPLLKVEVPVGSSWRDWKLGEKRVNKEQKNEVDHQEMLS